MIVYDTLCDAICDTIYIWYYVYITLWAIWPMILYDTLHYATYDRMWHCMTTIFCSNDTGAPAVEVFHYPGEFPTLVADCSCDTFWNSWPPWFLATAHVRSIGISWGYQQLLNTSTPTSRPWLLEGNPLEHLPWKHEILHSWCPRMADSIPLKHFNPLLGRIIPFNG